MIVNVNQNSTTQRDLSASWGPDLAASRSDEKLPLSASASAVPCEGGECPAAAQDGSGVGNVVFLGGIDPKIVNRKISLINKRLAVIDELTKPLKNGSASGRGTGVRGNASFKRETYAHNEVVRTNFERPRDGLPRNKKDKENADPKNTSSISNKRHAVLERRNAEIKNLKSFSNLSKRTDKKQIATLPEAALSHTDLSPDVSFIPTSPLSVLPIIPATVFSTTPVSPTNLPTILHKPPAVSSLEDFIKSKNIEVPEEIPEELMCECDDSNDFPSIQTKQNVELVHNAQLLFSNINSMEKAENSLLNLLNNMSSVAASDEPVRGSLWTFIDKTVSAALTNPQQNYSQVLQENQVDINRLFQYKRINEVDEAKKNYDQQIDSLKRKLQETTDEVIACKRQKIDLDATFQSTTTNPTRIEDEKLPKWKQILKASEQETLERLKQENLLKIQKINELRMKNDKENDNSSSSSNSEQNEQKTLSMGTDENRQIAEENERLIDKIADEKEKIISLSNKIKEKKRLCDLQTQKIMTIEKELERKKNEKKALSIRKKRAEEEFEMVSSRKKTIQLEKVKFLNK